MIFELPFIALIGFTIGFFSSIPVGPINLALIIRALHHHSKPAIFIAIGSGIMEFIYCLAAILGFSSLLFLPQVDKILQISSIAIFIIFGIKAIFFQTKQASIDEDDNSKDNNYFKFVMMGMVLYFSNPGFIAYWATVASLISGLRLFDYSSINNLTFASSIVGGSLFWSLLLISLVTKYKLKITDRIIKLISRIFGIIILLVCAYLTYNLVKGYF